MNSISLAENGFVPTWLIRAGIRSRLARKLEIESERPENFKSSLVDFLRRSPIAIATDDANQQHYEVPTDFYTFILGPRMKYSACLWNEDIQNLEQAEVASLKQVAQRAELSDNLKILELGCGWGSFSLWASETYPKSQFTAVSNSFTQADHIREQAHQRGIHNLKVITENMLDFHPSEQFDRIVSIEMFEHMRNYEQLLQRISSWLKDEGKLFVHIFSHKKYAYLYEAEDKDDWMSNYFFTGGIMPSHDLLSHFNKDLVIEQQWRQNGLNYTHTLEAWLKNLNRNEKRISDIFSEHYGDDQIRIWLNRWRMFILACSELFAYGRGEEWGISHYRFEKTKNPLPQ